MMKKITLTHRFALLFSCFCMSVTSLLAQTNGGPDLYGYVWRDNNDPNGPAYSWVDVPNMPGAVQASGLGDDNIVGPFSIGFPFHFYWYDVTTFRVGSNGYIGFTSGTLSHPFPLIPLPSQPQNYIAPMASDLTFTDDQGAVIPSAGLWYYTSPANDSLVVSWVDVPFWDPGTNGYIGSNSFQIVLSALDSSITFNYLNQNGVYNNPTNFCTIGIENNSGSIGLMHTHDILPPSIYTIKYYYPSTTSFTVNDASTVYNNNETTGGLFLSKDGAPFVLNAQIRNSGNTVLNPFNVSARVVNAFNQNQVTNTIMSDTLNPGEVQDMVFPNAFAPIATGAFRYLNTTQLTGDATPSNNTRELELHVVDTTAASILLSYDDSTEAGAGGLGWQGGGGGAGMLFYPPFYPCDLLQTRLFIPSNTNFFGFGVMIFADDGPGGTPMTLLDSAWVDPGNVIINDWNYVPLVNAVTIDSGGFYIAWVMGGDGITIGQNQTAPFSNRTFEILGQASNPASWSQYRYREIEDLMINVYISPGPVGFEDPKSDFHVGQAYPNPSSMKCTIDYDLASGNSPIEWKMFDVRGSLVMQGKRTQASGSGSLVIPVTNLPGGVYQLSLDVAGQRFNRQVSVVH